MSHCRRLLRYGVLGPMLLSAGSSFAWAQTPALPFDTPQIVGGIESVCTGVGEESQTDPRWNAYPLKLVIVGKGGQFLGDGHVTVTHNGITVTEFTCGGPWVLLKLAPNRYNISATIEGVTVSATATVSGSQQGRVVLRFPELGGSLSPEHVPAQN